MFNLIVKILCALKIKKVKNMEPNIEFVKNGIPSI